MLQNRSSVMMSPTYSLPWRPASSSSPGGGSSNSNSGGNGDDSAFHDSDPDYANSSASAHNEAGGGGAGNEYYASPANCLMPNKDSPDYEEVSNNPCSPRKGCLVYNLASEGIFARREEALEELDGGDPITREKIMQSLVYCIHKVSKFIAKRHPKLFSEHSKHPNSSPLNISSNAEYFLFVAWPQLQSILDFFPCPVNE